MAVREDGRSAEEQFNLQGGKDRKEDENGHVRSDTRSWPLQPEIRLPFKSPAKPSFAREIRPLIDKRSGPGRIIDIIGKERRRGIGLMTGTSMDAIDLAYVEISGRVPAPVSAGIIRSASFEYPSEIKKQLKALITPEEQPKALRGKFKLAWEILFEIFGGKFTRGAAAALRQTCRLDFLIGYAYAGAVNEFLSENGIAPEEVDFIATAGQTVWHEPQLIEMDTDWPPYHIKTRSTLAIGQAAVIAEHTGILTIGDLRVRDVAAGGHGAPIVPYADFVLLQDAHAARSIQNIGGIGNLTHVPRKPAGVDRVIAFDTGPGNMLIDYFAIRATDGKLEMDLDGELAREGRINQPLLEEWKGDPYFQMEPPKTTGRERFGEQRGRKAVAEHPGIPFVDFVATSTELTVWSICDAHERFLLQRGRPVDELIIGGGGGKNPVIMEGLAKMGIPLLSHEDVGIPSQFKEPMAIAVIGDDAIAGMTTNVSGATGGHGTVLGKINYNI